MKKEKEKRQRDLSALLPLVAIVIILTMIFGAVAYVSDLMNSIEERTISEYIQSSTVFSVTGHGEYKSDAPLFECVVYCDEDDISNLVGALSLGGWKPSVDRESLVDGGDKARVVFEATDLGPVQEHVDGKGLEARFFYKHEDKGEMQAMAYNEAYEEALEKAMRIASSTDETWRISEVSELGTTFDKETGIMSCDIRLSLLVGSGGNEEQD